MPRRKEPRIPDAVLDQLLAGADPQRVFDPNGLQVSSSLLAKFATLVGPSRRRCA